MIRSLRFLLLLWLVVAPVSAVGQEKTAIPLLWDPSERLQKPDLSALSRLRFLTTLDYPPFNFADGSGRLTGLNVDLARAICAELAITEKCQIQALPWAELEGAVSAGNGEAIVAGMTITPQKRESFAFSRPYMVFPGRFVAAKGSVFVEPLSQSLAGKTVGVLKGSGHEAMLRDLFARLQVTPFDTREALMTALRNKGVDAVFGDGMQLAFWLDGSDAAGCCAFIGGPYLAQPYFGSGLTIAVPASRPELVQAFNYALGQISAKGTFAELYLRYFPVGFF